MAFTEHTAPSAFQEEPLTNLNYLLGTPEPQTLSEHTSPTSFFRGGRSRASNSPCTRACTISAEPYTWKTWCPGNPHR
eukprot:361824-Pelagomonas_calceolata.AAC.1